MTNGEKIADAAFSWLGTPHINQAKIKGKGVDCGQLLIASLEDAGLIAKNAIKVKPYSNEFHLHNSEEWYLKIVQEYCDEVNADEMQTGDFLLFKIGRIVSHGAIFLGGRNVIHAVIGQGVIVADINDAMFYDKKGRSRLKGIYRFRSV